MGSHISRFSLPRFSASETVDDRMIAFMRLLLAAAGLLVIIIDPSEPDRLVAMTYTTLSLYTLYSAVLYVFTIRQPTHLRFVYRWSHWIDVGWFVVLVALSRGTSSLFFFGFFFATMVASFRWGFREGMSVSTISVILFSVVALATASDGAEFELNRFLLRPVFLLILGYMMSLWGGVELRSKHRLALLREVGRLSNPRFGVDRTIGHVMQQTRTNFKATSAILVLHDQATSTAQVRRADANDPQGGAQAVALPAHVASQLLGVAAHDAVVLRGPGQLLDTPAHKHAMIVRSVTGDQPATDGVAVSEAAAILEAASFVSVPIIYRDTVIGRGYLVSERRNAFAEHDIDFLLQLIEQVVPVIDNILLVDRLASDAANEERQRIARDLHDSVIQPYIGLQLGLTAVRQRHEAGLDVRKDIAQLADLTAEGIGELRGYVRDLRDGAERSDDLVVSLRRFADKFRSSTGIDVQVSTEHAIRVNHRLAAEAFQIAVEGLSNVRRHTNAQAAHISLGCANERLTVRIENPTTADATTPFQPRSITGRAQALGGYARVAQTAGRTAVIVEIPL